MNEHEEIAKALKARLSELRSHLAKVDRLVVVEHLATAPGPKTASGWLPEFIKDLFRRS